MPRGYTMQIDRGSYYQIAVSALCIKTGNLAGWINVDGSGVAWSLIVVPEHQHKGLGRAILHRAIQENKGRLRLYCSKERLSFYTELGFEVVRVNRESMAQRYFLEYHHLSANLNQRKEIHYEHRTEQQQISNQQSVG